MILNLVSFYIIYIHFFMKAGASELTNNRSVGPGVRRGWVTRSYGAGRSFQPNFSNFRAPAPLPSTSLAARQIAL